MLPISDIELGPFLEYCPEKASFAPSTFHRIKGIIRAKPEEKKLALAMFGTHDKNEAIAAYHGMGAPKYKNSFFQTLHRDYELVGAFVSSYSQLETIMRIVNSILVRGRKLDALFLIAHGDTSRFGIEKSLPGDYLRGEDFSKDLFEKMSTDGVIVTQACCAGEDRTFGFARQLSEKTGWRVVIAPPDDSYDSVYEKGAIFPFSFHIREPGKTMPKEKGTAYFYAGRCTVNLRSKL